MNILEKLPAAAIQDAITLTKYLWASFDCDELYEKYGIEDVSYYPEVREPWPQGRVEVSLLDGNSLCVPSNTWSDEARDGVSLQVQLLALLTLDFLRQLPPSPEFSDISIPANVLRNSVEMQQNIDMQIAMEEVIATLENAADFWLDNNWDCPGCKFEVRDGTCEIKHNSVMERYELPTHGLGLCVYENEALFIATDHRNVKAQQLADEWNQRHDVYLHGVAYWKDAFPSWIINKDEVFNVQYSLQTLKQLASLPDAQLAKITAFHQTGDATGDAYISPFTGKKA